MISMSAIGSASGAASYYTAQAKVEYYAHEIVPSAWGGKGLHQAGLSGEVTAEALTQVLAGQVRELDRDKSQSLPRESAQAGIDPATAKTLDPATREVHLGRTVIEKATGARQIEHRPGWDLTFAPPKSVSIESEVFGRTGVRHAHETAVTAAMEYLEANAAQTRYLHQAVPTGNLVYSTFAHATSRAGDPQTHTHVLVANVTYLNGKAYSLSNEQLLRQRTTADAVYRNELASGLARQGYRLDFDRRGHFEIAGYDRAQLADFSQRAAQIESALQARGSSLETASYESRQIAVLATRQDKAHDHTENAAAHRERWQAQARALGIEPAHTQFAAQSFDFRPETSAQALISSAAASLAEREQVFTKRDLVQEAMLQSSGRVPSAELLAQIQTHAKEGALVPRDANWAGERYTTPGAIRAEQWADRQLNAGRDAHVPVMRGADFDRALAAFEIRKGFELSPEQTEAARQILTRADRFQGVQGAAGAGKTTMLEFVREAAEGEGWTVRGMSAGAAQASQLQADSGIESTTTVAFLAGQRRQAPAAELDPSDIAQSTTPLLYINDEASMSGQRDFNGVIRATLDTGARTVFVGDKAQHQSVAAGSAFQRAQDHMSVAWLSRINRQTTEEAREPVRSVIAGRHADAIRQTAREFNQAQAQVTQKWDAVAARKDSPLTPTQTATQRDQLKAARALDNQAAIGAIASDYTALAPEARERTAVITGTNADRQALNTAIRGRLLDAGELDPGSAQTVPTLQRKDLTRAQAAQASSYDKGDVLRQAVRSEPGEAKKPKGRGRKASRAALPDRHLQVEAIDAQRNTVTVRSGGELQTLDAQDLAALTGHAAYTVQPREFAVGDRVAFLENAKALGVHNGDLGTVRRIDAAGMTVEVAGQRGEAGSTREVPFETYRQLDHGYVMTSHKVQGQTVDRTLIHHNTEGGMHGQREAYVNVTRARLSTTTYTQDRERAGEQAARVVDKTRAMAGDRGVGSDGLTPEDRRPGWRRQPERMKQTRQAWRQPEQVAGRATDRTAEHPTQQTPRPPARAIDDLAFTPASYADVTLKPGERYDPVRDLLAQHVPQKVQVAQDLRAEAMAFARQAGEQFTAHVRAEQAAMAFARETSDRFTAQMAQERTQQQALQAHETQRREQELQARAEREAQAKLELQKAQEKGRDRGGWEMSR